MSTYPGPPDVLMAEEGCWHLVQTAGGPDLTGTLGSPLDLWFDVLGQPQAQRPETSRLAQPANGGPPTLLLASLALQPRQFRVETRFNMSPNRDARIAALEAAWAARGPYLLTAPSITLSALYVLLDASQGPLQYTPEGGARHIVVGFQDIGAVPTTGAGTAALTWTYLDRQPGAQYTGRVTWAYSGTDQALTDGLWLYQPGTTSSDIATNGFDPSTPMAWYPIVGTNGQRTGDVAVTVSASVFETFPTWQLGYYSQANGLVATALTVTV